MVSNCPSAGCEKMCKHPEYLCLRGAAEINNRTLLPYVHFYLCPWGKLKRSERKRKHKQQTVYTCEYSLCTLSSITHTVRSLIWFAVMKWRTLGWALKPSLVHSMYILMFVMYSFLLLTARVFFFSLTSHFPKYPSLIQKFVKQEDRKKTLGWFNSFSSPFSFPLGALRPWTPPRLKK